MTKRMLIDDTQPEETRVVIVDGNKVEDVEFESSCRKQIKGNIYTAKVIRVEPSLQAAFVDYGGNKHGFLAFSEIHPDYYNIAPEMVEAVEFNTTENVSGNQSEQSENNVSGNTEQSEQTNEESKKGANLHIIKTPDGIIAGSSALKEAINSSLNKHGISTNYQNDILVDYYNVTVNKDNTKIHNDVIDNLVSSLADALKAQQQNQNQNTGSSSSSNNNQDYEENDSGVAEGYTPSEDPFAGDFEFDDLGDGGPITGDAEAIIP